VKAPTGNVDFETTALDYLMRRAVFPDCPFIRLKKTLVGTKNANVADLRNSQSGFRNGHRGRDALSNVPAG
jgi:hypothetical protein